MKSNLHIIGYIYVRLARADIVMSFLASFRRCSTSWAFCLRRIQYAIAELFRFL